MLRICLACRQEHETSSKVKGPYICIKCSKKGYEIKEIYPTPSRKFRKNKKNRTVGAVTAQKVNIGKYSLLN